MTGQRMFPKEIFEISSGGDLGPNVPRQEIFDILGGVGL